MDAAESGLCLSVSGKTAFVSTASGELQAVDAATGRLLASISIDGCPMVATGNQVVVLGTPDTCSAGRVTLLEVDGDAMSQLWSEPLLTQDQWEGLGPGFAGSDSHRFAASFVGGQVVVVGTIATSYQGGAAPSEAVMAGADGTVAVHCVYDRATGAVETQRANGQVPSSALGNLEQFGRSAWLSDPASAEWTIPNHSGDNTSVRLEPGADAVQVADDRVFYRVVEPAPNGGGLRRYLRSMPLTASSSEHRWSHLIDQSTGGGPPPLPQ